MFEGDQENEFEILYEDEDKTFAKSSSSGRLASLWGSEGPDEEFVVVDESMTKGKRNRARTRCIHVVDLNLCFMSCHTLYILTVILHYISVYVSTGDEYGMYTPCWYIEDTENKGVVSDKLD